MEEICYGDEVNLDRVGVEGRSRTSSSHGLPWGEKEEEEEENSVSSWEPCSSMYRRERCRRRTGGPVMWNHPKIQYGCRFRGEKNGNWSGNKKILKI